MKNKRKKKQYRFINGAKGVISLFLCIVMTPILSVAGMLVEFSRYQGATSIAEELMDASILSVLGNYDEYIEKRFGLFAVSQDCDIEKTYENLYQNNSAILGNAIDQTSFSNAYGINSLLTDEKVLEQQILDFSESTVLTEVMLEDLQLQKLLDELTKLSNITDIFSKISKMKDLTSAVKDMVKSGEKLVETVEDISTSITNVKTKATELSGSIVELYKKLMNDTKFVATLPDSDSESENSDDTEELGSESVKYVIETYINSVRDIYQRAQDLYDEVIDIKNAVTVDIPSKISKFTTDVNKAKAALNEVKNTKKVTDDEKSKEEKVTNDSLSVLDTIISEIESVLNKSVEKLSTDTLNSLKNEADLLVETVKTNLGLDDVDQFLNIENYSWDNLSAATKDNIKKVLSQLDYDNWDSSDDALEDLKKNIIDVFLPDIFSTDTYSDIVYILSDAISLAEDRFINSVKDSISQILTNLVNSIKSMFELDVFYDADLCAYVTGGGNTGSPYEGFLTALQKVMDAKEKIENGGFFNVIGGIYDMLDATQKAWTTMWNILQDTIGQIGTFIEYIQNPKELYNMFLVSGYSVHNFPNRTNAGDSKWETDLSGYRVELVGSSLTGYSFNEIARPIISTTGAKQTGISGLLNSIKASASGSETHLTFMGAELEYIMAGTSSEIANQAIVFMQTYVLRLLLDIVAVFSDTNVAAMASATGPAAFVVYLLVLLGEPLIDTIFLVNGGEAPLIKSNCYLTPMGIPKMVSQLLSITVQNEALHDSIEDANLEGKLTDSIANYVNENDYEKFTNDGSINMDYDTHCLIILLAMTKKENVLKRISNLIYFESRYHYSQMNAEFNFDRNKAYTSIIATTDVKFNSFIEVFQFNDVSFMETKFSVTRGY